ncbi:isoprenylcysteine carboxylmethyltransferase family protein [Bradyrhizobium sp. 31Argb]|uniref:methyltransferase family protein n=1 Tax=Bradyrhizobium sp. 31Argb TaxID=3141247 RepID=UPI0037483847
MVKVTLQIVVWTAIVAAMILWPAGTLAYPGGWAFLAVFAIGGLAITLWLAKRNPRLLRERMSSPVQRDQKPWDRIWLTLFIVLFCAWMMFMSWDAARTGFTAVPVWLQVVGGVLTVLYLLGVWWTFRENTFAAPVVKIQEDQRVIDTGPYAIVRHPMYASALLLIVGLPLLLGSWIGLAMSVVFILAIAWRTLHEEGALRAELKGYDEYAARVRYRFIPSVW